MNSDHDKLKEQTKGHRWVKGQSGNPGGQHKDKGITAVQIEMLDKICPYSKNAQTWREYLAERGLVLATEQARAMEDLKSRIEGKIITPIGATGEITLTIKYDR